MPVAAVSPLPASQADATGAGLRVESWGRCLADASTLAHCLSINDYAGLVTLRGDNYSLAIEAGGSTTLVGSSIAPRNLFYAQVSGRLHYGPTVLDVVRKARLPWRWNWRGLADVSTLEHNVEGETLHAEVRKVDPASVVQFDGRRLVAWQMPWNERVKCSNASPDAAVSALVAACKLHADGDVVVPMSAGFDSRLLLACLISIGMRPRLITLGDGSGTDARVASAIAKHFGLKLDLVPLDVSSYLDHGAHITEITGGAKTFQNWHSYALARNAPVNAESRVFIGANGEAARTYYLDKGIASLAADAFASKQTRRAFWKAKLRCVFTPAQRAMLDARLASELDAPLANARAERLAALSCGSLLSGLDRFYTEQRVSQFIAQGMALIDASATAVAPMLDREWMAQAWHLPRRWKLDSRWHRYAIGKLCPELLAFDEEKTGLPMRSTPRALYWLPARNRPAPAPYADYRRVLESAEVRHFLAHSGEWLEPVAGRELVASVFGAGVKPGDGVRAGSFLLSLLFLQQQLRTNGIAVED
jgi:hypothetical protein